MRFEEYQSAAQRAADLVGRGRYADAIEVLNGLVDAGISDLDRAMMCVNLATAYAHTGDEDEALRWYERGVALEDPLMRFVAAEHRAAFLAGIGRSADALAAYRGLLDRPELMESDRERIQANVAALRSGQG